MPVKDKFGNVYDEHWSPKLTEEQKAFFDSLPKLSRSSFDRLYKNEFPNDSTAEPNEQED